MLSPNRALIAVVVLLIGVLSGCRSVPQTRLTPADLGAPLRLHPTTGFAPTTGLPNLGGGEIAILAGVGVLALPVLLPWLAYEWISDVVRAFRDQLRFDEMKPD